MRLFSASYPANQLSLQATREGARSDLCRRSRLAQQPKKCYRDGRGRLRTEEQPQRADAFHLENLRILQDANARRVRRVGNHQ